MSFAIGILAALAAALLYSVGVTLQSIEARDAPEEEGLSASLIQHLATRPRWLGGTGCVLAAWGMQVTALTLIPITIVQPALAVSVLALLGIGVRFFGESAQRREVTAALAIVLGVAGIAAASPGQTSSHASPLILTAGLGVLALVALIPYAFRGHHRFGGLVTVSAGLAYAWTGFSTTFMTDGMSSGAWLVAGLWLCATVAAAGIGLVSEMTALQSRSAIHVFPVVLVVQILVAVLLSPLLAGESRFPHPLLIAVLAASVAVLLAGTHALAGSRAVGGAIAVAGDEADVAGADGLGAPV